MVGDEALECIILDNDTEKITLILNHIFLDCVMFKIKVQQGFFCGEHDFIFPDYSLDHYYEELNKLYETLEGEFTAYDSESFGHVTFSINCKGHLLLRVWLGRWKNQTHAEFWIYTDQTVLNSFLQYMNCIRQRILTLKNT